jgi:hypothetical protein
MAPAAGSKVLELDQALPHRANAIAARGVRPLATSPLPGMVAVA